MINQSIISGLVKEKIADTNYYIVDISVSSSNQIRVEIDSDEGVKIHDCVQISRHIEGSLDRDEEDFELTVSSAGLGQPLKILRQYQSYLGREVQTVIYNGEKLKGKLLSADEHEMSLEVTSREKVEGKKKRQTIIKEIKVPMEQIKETKVIISFK